MPPAKPQPKRYAIYTRKSSEEGLEQDFNSLQAQRESYRHNRKQRNREKPYANPPESATSPLRVGATMAQNQGIFPECLEIEPTPKGRWRTGRDSNPGWGITPTTV
jgi:hypothetical protein